MCSGTSKQSLAERKKENFIFTAVKHIHNTYVWPSALGCWGGGGGVGWGVVFFFLTKKKKKKKNLCQYIKKNFFLYLFFVVCFQFRRYGRSTASHPTRKSCWYIIHYTKATTAHGSCLANRPRKYYHGRTIRQGIL